MNNKDSHVQIDSAREQPGFSFRMPKALLICSLLFLVFFIYSNTLHGPFIFDDGPNIEENPNVRLTQLTLGGIKRAGLQSPMKGRPLSYISFGLNYYIDRYDVLGYHLVNILIHASAGIFLYLFLKTTLNLPSLRSRYEPYGWLPFVAALIWLIHPLQTQSVTYIVQRMNSMAAMFYVLAFLLYVRARLAEERWQRWSLFAGCALASILSLGSKEISATLPFFIFLYEWYFFQDLSWSWLRRRLFLFVVLFTFLAAVALVYLGADPVERVLSSYAARDFTLTQRVLTEFRVVIFYLSLLLFPHPSRLNLDHDFFLSQSLLNPVTTILSIGAIVGLVVLAIYLARRERLLSFCILWFLGNLVIESSVIGLEIVFEHRTYLPSMLVSVVAVSLAYRLIKHRWLGVAVVCSVAVVFSFWTYARNSVWSDEVVLWQDCVKKSPQKARPHNNLGFALMEQGKIDEVIGHYRQALRIKPDYAEAHNNLGHALIERDEFDKGISHFSEGLRLECELKDRLMARGMLDKVARNPHKALRSEPDLKDLLNSLGVARFKEGKIKEAASYYRAALRIKPDYAAAHYNLGLALAAQGKLDEAISHYSEALRLDPDFAQVHNNLGIALFKKGDLEGAVVNFREALRIKPDFAKASRNLQVALERQRKSQGYAAKSQKASELQSGDPVLHYKLGNFYKAEGKFNEAIEEYEKALSIEPGFTDAMNNLALLYVSRGQHDKALPLYMKLIELGPDSYVVYYNLACMYARQNKVEQSIGWLRGAVGKGFKDWDHLISDEDLENIRSTSYFKELAQRAKKQS